MQIFDSWAGMLNANLYDEFCMPYLKRITDEIQTAPKIVFSKGAYFALDKIHALDAQVTGLDWTMSAKSYRATYGFEQVIQGNLDPCVLYGNNATLDKHLNQIINDFGGRHIFNLGHGVYPDTPLSQVKYLINQVKSFRYST